MQWSMLELLISLFLATVLLASVFKLIKPCDAIHDIYSCSNPVWELMFIWRAILISSKNTTLLSNSIHQKVNKIDKICSTIWGTVHSDNTHIITLYSNGGYFICLNTAYSIRNWVCIFYEQCNATSTICVVTTKIWIIRGYFRQTFLMNTTKFLLTQCHV